MKSDATTNIPLLLTEAASIESSEKSQSTKEETRLLAVETRRFDVIEGLADRIHPGNEIFPEPEPLTSAASKPSSSLKVAFHTNLYIVNTTEELWRSKPPTVKTSDKTLLHLFGDFFGQSTGLEGYSQTEAFKFYRDLITSFIADESDSAGLHKMRAHLEQAISVSRLLYGDTDNFRNELKTRLEPLGASESIFFAGGWKGDPAGHGLIYEVIKQNDEAFTFRLYNTGEGTQRHASETIQLKSKVVPYVEISNISLEKILERPFLNAWQNLQTEIPQQHPWQADDIYIGLLSQLGGESHPVMYGEEDLMTPQRSGTCAFMSLQAFFYHLNVEKSVSQKIRFKLLSAGIKHYVQSNGESLKTSPQTQNLFSKSLEEFSRITIEMHAKEIIDDKELLKASEQIKEYQQLLKLGKQTYQSEVERGVIRLNLHESAIGWKAEIPISEDLILNPNRLVSTDKTPLVYLTDLKNWEPQQETLLADLTFYLEALKKGVSDQSHLSVLLETQRLVQKLNLSKITFPKEETAKIIEKLHALGFLFTKAFNRAAGSTPIPIAKWSLPICC